MTSCFFLTGISIRPRYVYVVRDGRDCAVSFYKHLSAQAPEDGGYTKGWDTFFDEWIDGKIAFGGKFILVIVLAIRMMSCFVYRLVRAS